MVVTISLVHEVHRDDVDEQLDSGLRRLHNHPPVSRSGETLVRRPRHPLEIRSGEPCLRHPEPHR